jgi:beta-glucosidase
MASWNDTSRSTGVRAAALLAEMTIEEKASQLGSVWVRPPRQDEVGGEVAPMESVFSSSGLDQVAAGGLGHLTRTFGTEPVEVAEGVARLRAAQRRVVELNRSASPRSRTRSASRDSLPSTRPCTRRPSPGAPRSTPS